jgi:hypothetical protein
MMANTLKISIGPDPRILAEYGQAKSLLQEKKAIQRRLREVDKRLRELRAVAVTAIDCAMHDMAYEAHVPPLLAKENLPTIFK